MVVKYKPVLLNGKSIIGYRIGNDGSVWSCRKRSCVVTLGNEWHQLKPIKKDTGHMMITVMVSGKQKCLYIHRLVLEAFVGPCPEGMECCHEDDNPSNNNLSNLRWGTRLDNSKDKKRNGRTNRGEKSPTAKLTAEDVIAIRLRRNGGEKAVDLSREYKMSYGAIMDILHYRRWSHIR